MTTINDRELSTDFQRYLVELVNQRMGVKLLVGIPVLGYFAWSDLYELNSIPAFYTRLLPLVLMSVLLFFVWLDRDRHAVTRKVLYHTVLVSLTIMMYAKCLVHIHCPNLAAHATGTILIIFLISLEMKTTLIKTVFLYFLPLVVFTIIWKFVLDVSREQYLVLVNIYPIVIIGFTVSVLQQELRFKAFKTGRLLEKEKAKTEHLYNEAEMRNRHLNEINEKLIQSEEKLKKMIKVRDRFLSIIAHDLRGPFNGLTGFSEILLRNIDGLKPEEVRQYSHEIYQLSNTLLSLTDNLLSWARNQSDEMEVKPEIVDVRQSVSNVFKVLQINADTKSLKLVNDIKKDVFLKVDASMFAVIIRNLVSNAIKFSHPNEVVTVRSEPGNEMIKIIVEDHGIGFHSKDASINILLEKNYTTGGTAGETGSGLGLVVCKEFVEKNDGSIEIKSEANKGTTVVVLLPSLKNDTCHDSEKP